MCQDWARSHILTEEWVKLSCRWLLYLSDQQRTICTMKACLYSKSFQVNPNMTSPSLSIKWHRVFINIFSPLCSGIHSTAAPISCIVWRVLENFLSLKQINHLNIDFFYSLIAFAYIFSHHEYFFLQNALWLYSRFLDGLLNQKTKEVNIR